MAARRDQIKSIVQEMNESDTFIDSADAIKKASSDLFK